MKINVCNLGRTKIILGMPQLATHNLEIDWEKGEVKMARCPLLCEVNQRKKESKEKEKIKKEEKIDEEVVKELVLKKFWKWKRVFGKAESEYILVQKTQDHVIELKEEFMPKKKIYLLSKEEQEEV